MNDEDKIKPAEIQDEDLNAVQGGERVMQTSGIRAMGPTGLRPPATDLSKTTLETQDSDDLLLGKPGRTTYANITLKRG